MYQRLRNVWLRISLKWKLTVYAMILVLLLSVSAAFNFRLMDFALGNFNEILDDNSRCHDLQEAIDLEISAFERYARERSEEAWGEYSLSCARSERCIRFLPFDYNKIGAERYARTWTIRNAYESYSRARNQLILMDMNDKTYVHYLYQVYKRQSYLQGYVRRLLQVTLEEGNKNYQSRVPVFYNMPYLILIFSVVMMAAALGMSRLLFKTFLVPVEKLAGSARKIAVNDFGGEDLQIDNKDEMGELVQAFNKMKHATAGYISTLMKNYEMSELLHHEEMEKVQMEKQLDAARLELLKSQINPHFLFNTLNTISCMAKLEDASTTERMITSMSNLFRYNLKMNAQIVPLGQELKVVEDYLYIQQMRFGSRVQYRCELKVDKNVTMIPAFTLQPLVENAIIHGLSKKEQGGRIWLRAWPQGQRLVVSVADTGVGMSESRRRELEQAMDGKRTARIGIGLGNIYQRIRNLYDEGEMRIYSREGHGTVIQIRIPLGGQEECGEGGKTESMEKDAEAEEGKGQQESD